MNQRLLELLQQSEGYCSGEILSEQLGITRSAVWKQINQLREEGYEITSIPRKGYYLKPGYLNCKEIKNWLRGNKIGRHLYVAPSVTSTNDWACEKMEVYFWQSVKQRAGADKESSGLPL